MDQTSLIPTEAILSSGINLHDYIETLEKALVFAAIQKSDGNKAAAARYLGIKRSTLMMKLKKWDGDGWQTAHKG